MWIPRAIDSLDADFRAFYRIDGIAEGRFGGLSAERFFALCERTVAYEGATRAAIMRAREELGLECWWGAGYRVDIDND